MPQDKNQITDEVQVRHSRGPRTAVDREIPKDAKRPPTDFSGLEGCPDLTGSFVGYGVNEFHVRGGSVELNEVLDEDDYLVGMEVDDSGMWQQSWTVDPDTGYITGESDTDPDDVPDDVPDSSVGASTPSSTDHGKADS